jgi:hypothetical protein
MLVDDRAQASSRSAGKAGDEEILPTEPRKRLLQMSP